MALTKVIGSGIGTVANQFADANMSSQSVIQIIQGGRTTSVTHNSTTYTDVGVSAAIQPSSTSSKIFIMLTGTLGNANTGNHTILRMFRGISNTNFALIGNGTGGGNSNLNGFMGMIQGSTAHPFSGFGQTFLDAPSTTTSTTYKIQMAALNGTGSLGRRGDDAQAAIPTRLILMEIAG